MNPIPDYEETYRDSDITISFSAHDVVRRIKIKTDKRVAYLTPKDECNLRQAVNAAEDYLDTKYKRTLN